MQDKTQQGGGVVGMVCGIILGVFVSTSWARHADLPLWNLFVPPGVIAILGYFFGDRFWLVLARMFRLTTLGR